MMHAVIRTTEHLPPGSGIPVESPPRPLHDAVVLTAGGQLADIRLGDQVYTLRITRAGKLILTK